MSNLYNKIRDGKIRLIGTHAICNYGDLVIYETNNNTCVSAFNFVNGVVGVRETSIHYTMTGRPYIIRYQKAYYLDEIMRA